MMIAIKLKFLSIWYIYIQFLMVWIFIWYPSCISEDLGCLRTGNIMYCYIVNSISFFSEIVYELLLVKCDLQLHLQLHIICMPKRYIHIKIYIYIHIYIYWWHLVKVCQIASAYLVCCWNKLRGPRLRVALELVNGHIAAIHVDPIDPLSSLRQSNVLCSKA